MLPIDLSHRNAFVTGVSDDGGFAWQIAKSLQAAGANVYLACHPRVIGIVENILTRAKYAESRKLPYGLDGELRPAGLIKCDVQFDTAADIPEALRDTKGYRDDDVSIEGAFRTYRELSSDAPLDILVHAVAFSPEIQVSHLETSRNAYLVALSVSSYSLVALTRAAVPYMEGRGGSVVGLTALAGERITPGYGGGMASAKAALESDARALAWFTGPKNIRVNLISAGPFPSRAARSIGDVQAMIDGTAARSPLRRPIERQEVADAALFLASPLASGITATTLYVDAGFHAMSPFG